MKNIAHNPLQPRHYSQLDQLFMGIDVGMRTLFGQPKTTERPNPAHDITEANLSESERKLASRLMRINHAGEVAAQGLYQGQALTARLPQVRQQMEQAAQEENDHLDWCKQRTKEMGGHVSFLNPVWYVGSVTIGTLAGAAGDKWSLGFVAETEKQVVKHLESHLEQLPEHDTKSRAILDQMKEDEGRHATVALEAGAAKLPYPVKKLMKLTSKIMTRTAFWV